MTNLRKLHLFKCYDWIGKVICKLPLENSSFLKTGRKFLFLFYVISIV